MNRVILLLSTGIFIIFLGSSVLAEEATPRLFVSHPSPSDRGSCPNQGGALDSVSVPVNESIELVVLTPIPAGEGGASFQLSATNPEIVAVGDRTQSFLPIVTVPEGATQSNPFTVFGRTVGASQISATSLSPEFTGFTVPAGAWDVGPDGNRRFLDPNRFVDAANCRASIDSPELTDDEAILSDCGEVARGVAADGISRLLMRTRSGLQGVACFEIVNIGSSNPGEISVPVKTATPIDGLFQASSYYKAPEAFEDEGLRREVEIEFSYTSAIGNGNTTRFRARLDIVRPPVILLHGLWSSGGAWSTFWQRNTPDFTTELGDYEATNGRSFSENSGEVRTFAAAAVEGSREKGYATTRADLLGHSMGGLLGRLYAQSPEHARPDNLGAGDLRRVLTLATPHYGSNFANLVVALHHSDDVQTQETIDSLLGEDIAGGAVCDLAENSPALAGIGATSLPANAVVATGGPEGSTGQPAEYWGGVFGMKNFEKALTRERCIERNMLFQCVEREFDFDQSIIDGYRFREANDVIVPASSARGGLGVANTARFDVIHFGADMAGLSVVNGPTNTEEIRNHSLALLDEDLTDGAWGGSWPAALATGTGAPRSVPGEPGADNATIYADQCSPGGALKPASRWRPAGGDRTFGRTIDPGIQIVSPAPGSSHESGQMLTVEVGVGAGITVIDAGVRSPGIGLFEADDLDQDGFSAEVPLGAGLTGPITLIAVVQNDQGDRLQSEPMQIIVQPGDAPKSVVLAPSTLRLDLQNRTSGRVRLIGLFDNGIELDFSHPSMGTVYESVNPEIAEVDSNGKVFAIAQGHTMIIASNGEHTAFASVIVTESTGETLPPEPLSDQVEVRGSGFRLNRNTGFFVQELSIANPQPFPVRGPFLIRLSELTSGISLVNRDTVTRHLEPIGEPVIQVELDGDGVTLQPGQTRILTLQFLNPERLPVRYTPIIYRSASGI